MADEEAKAASPFDVNTVRALVALMSRHDLSEIDLREGDQRIRLRRGQLGPVAAAPAAPQMPAPTGHAAPTPTAPTTDAQPAKPPAKALHTITCPTPGTFYSSATPGAEPFVRVGAKVTPTTVVCLIEAMKIFNEIQAECSGVIAEILVENRQSVEYGQVLFRVDPAG